MMARYYGIPSMCGGLSSDAKELDAQAAFEKAVTAVPSLMEGADIIYRTKDILAQHRPPPLPAEVEAELERVVRRYLGPDFHFD